MYIFGGNEYYYLEKKSKQVCIIIEVYVFSNYFNCTQRTFLQDIVEIFTFLSKSGWQIKNNMLVKFGEMSDNSKNKI